MKKTTILAICVALVSATGAVKADFITGELQLAGTGTFNAAPIGSATVLNSVNSTFVTGAFDDLSTVSSASFSLPGGGWVLNGTTPIINYLSFGGFTFVLNNSATTPAGAFYVNDFGYGTLFGNGYSPTVFAYSFTADESHSTVNAGYSVDLYSVPDGGTTVALLGGALTVLGLIRRKLVA